MTDGPPVVLEQVKSPQLTDAEARARAHPQTFAIPPLADRKGLTPGQIVKLIFDDKERMWVVVELRAEGPEMRYIGKLDNHPVGVTGLNCGDLLFFEPKHVAEISAERASTGNQA